MTTALNAETLQFIAAETGGTYHAFKKRRQLFAALEHIIEKQGIRSQREYTYTYPLRYGFFLGAFLFLLPFWKLEDHRS